MLGLDVKHLRAVVALAEERHFSRAAARIPIGQSGLTKQIVTVEAFLGFPLFVREPRRVALTPAGEVFVSEARRALQHVERAIHLSKGAVEAAVQTCNVGKSPYTDPYLISKLLSLRFPLFPHIRIELTTKLAFDLKQDLLEGGLDLAFLTGVPETARLTGSLVADQRFFVAMLQDDVLACGEQVDIEVLRQVSCLMFERHVQPFLYDEFMRIVRPASQHGCHLHHVMTAEDALQMVLRGCGVAILSQAGAWRIMREGVTIRPLVGKDLRLRTEIVARADNESRLISDVVRSLRKALTSTKAEAQFRLDLPA